MSWTNFIPFFNLIAISFACKGCINLDEYNFDKILSRFDAVLVKFDVAYPYGKEHDTFTSVASDLVDNRNLILAQVGVKDYGERENEALANKYGLQNKDDFPTLKLFAKGSDNPYTFPKNSNWNVENIKQFIRDNTNIYIGLPGCIEQFDKFAGEFMVSENKKAAFEKAEKELSKLDESDKPIGTTYLKFMSKIIENGVQFIKQEKARLEKIIKEGKINNQKKNELSHRLNIIKSFASVKVEL